MRRLLLFFVCVLCVVGVKAQDYHFYRSAVNQSQGNANEKALVGATLFKSVKFTKTWHSVESSENGQFQMFCYLESEREAHLSDANEGYYIVAQSFTYYRKDNGKWTELQGKPENVDVWSIAFTDNLNNISQYDSRSYAAVGNEPYNYYHVLNQDSYGWQEQTYSEGETHPLVDYCETCTSSEGLTTPTTEGKYAAIGGQSYTRIDNKWIIDTPTVESGWDASTGTLSVGGDDTASGLMASNSITPNDVNTVKFNGGTYDKATGTLTATSADYETMKAQLKTAGFTVSKIVLGDYVTIENGKTIITIDDGQADVAFPSDNLDSSDLSAAERAAVMKATDLKLVGEINNNGWGALQNKAGSASTAERYISGYEEKPVQQKNEKGEPLEDEDGNPIYEPVWVEVGFDDEGNPIYEKKKDDNGNVVYVTEMVPTYASASYVHNLDLSAAKINDSYCKLTNNFRHVETVILPTDANYKNIPEGFATSTQLRSITIPSQVETIGKSAFAGCGMLETVNWDENGSLRRFEESAFENCNITGDLVFPPSVEYIGPKAFKNSLNISSVTFPQGSNLWGEGHGIMAEAFWMDGKENALKNVYVLDTQHLVNCDVMAFDYDNTDGQTQMNTVKTRLHYPPEYYYYYVGEWKARVNGGIIAGHDDLLALRTAIETGSANIVNGDDIVLSDEEKQWVNGFQKFVSSGIPVTFDTQWRTYSDVVNIRVPKAVDRVADVYIVCGYEAGKGVLLKQMKEDDIIPAHTGIIIRHYVNQQEGNGLLTFRHVTESSLTEAEKADSRVFDRYCYVVEDPNIFVDQRTVYHEDAHENTTGIHTRLYKPTGETLSGEFADGYPNYLEFLDCKGKQRVIYNAENNNITVWSTLEMDPFPGQKVTYRNFFFGNGKLLQHAKEVYDAWKRDPEINPNPNKYGDYTGVDWKADKEGQMDWGFFRTISNYYKINSKAFLHYPANVFTKAKGGSQDAIINGEIVAGAKSISLFIFDTGEKVTSGIEAVSAFNPNQKGNNAYYTLQGVKVKTPKERGIYILNGKKVMVK